MDLRGLAVIGCRLLALFLAIAALAALPSGFAAWQQAPRAGAASWTAASGLLLQVLVATGLWFAAPWLADRIGHRDARRLRAADGETLARAVFIAAGVLVLVACLDDLLRLFSALTSGPRALSDPRVLAPALGFTLKLGFALALLFGARRLALRLRVQDAAPTFRHPDEASAARLIGELVGAAGTLGVRRLTDLALTIKAEAEDVAKRVVRSSLDTVIAAVELRRPDFSRATAADGTVTIVFSDMEGFSAMTQRLGDQAAHQVVKAHNRIVRRAVRTHAGQEVELQGDGFLLAFPDPAQALRCAATIQRHCAEYSQRHPQTPIRVRIGLHCGTPIQEGDRFFGITVILAARIAAQAAGGEVLVSEAVRAAVGDASFRYAAPREAELKGLDGRHRMYPLEWRAA